ncbi:MAG: hypothetical protein KKH28_14600 [Elusimicrobia bacterium]|nr:hypothetical protein [Elusimicrobiota bacterium]
MNEPTAPVVIGKISGKLRKEPVHNKRGLLPATYIPHISKSFLLIIPNFSAVTSSWFESVRPGWKPPWNTHHYDKTKKTPKGYKYVKNPPDKVITARGKHTALMGER